MRKLEKPRPEPVPSRESPPDGEPRPRRTILVVEDEASQRRILERRLQRWGHDVVAMEDGSRAWECLRTSDAPRLAIVDWEIPGIEGVDLCRMVKRLPRPDPIYMILLTGRDTTEDVVAGLAAGADDYLVKPYVAQELKARLEVGFRVLDRQDQMAREWESRLDDLRTRITLALPHELRTPLNIILGAADIMREPDAPGDRDTVRALGDSIHRSALRLHRTLDRLLIYAQVEIAAGDPGHVRSWIATGCDDGPARIRRAVETEQSRHGRPVAMRIELGDAVVGMLKEHLSTIVAELVDNALKFSPPDAGVRVEAEAVNAHLRLTVHDDGPGIPPEQVEHLGAFVQFTNFRDTEGLGLGLVVCKRLTELYGGRFTIEGASQRGTTVTVDLPLRREPGETGDRSQKSE